MKESPEIADHKLRISSQLMEQMFTRTQRGRRIRVMWGEPDAEGFHTPTIREEEDPYFRFVQAVIAVWEHCDQHLDGSCLDTELHGDLLLAEKLAWRDFSEWRAALGLKF